MRFCGSQCCPDHRGNYGKEILTQTNFNTDILTVQVVLAPQITYFLDSPPHKKKCFNPLHYAKKEAFILQIGLPAKASL